MYDGEPPCWECATPEGLSLAAAGAWHLWALCHRFGRDGNNGALRLEAALAYARAHDLTRYQLALALTIETHVWPRIKPHADDPH